MPGALELEGAKCKAKEFSFQEDGIRNVKLCKCCGELGRLSSMVAGGLDDGYPSTLCRTSFGESVANGSNFEKSAEALNRAPLYRICATAKSMQTRARILQHN